jgi:HAMP domain-containing protein
MSRRTLRSIDELRAGTAHLAAGRYETRVTPPGEAELAELTQRPCDPLVARVAGELQQAIATGAGIGDEALGANGLDPALLRLALCELHQTVGQLQG